MFKAIMNQNNNDNQDRETLEVDIDGENFVALLFEVRGDDDELQELAKRSGGAIYTWLDCDGTEVLLRGRHLVNRIWYLVLPSHAPEEIVISHEHAN